MANVKSILYSVQGLHHRCLVDRWTWTERSFINQCQSASAFCGRRPLPGKLATMRGALCRDRVQRRADCPSVRLSVSEETNASSKRGGCDAMGSQFDSWNFSTKCQPACGMQDQVYTDCGRKDAISPVLCF